MEIVEQLKSVWNSHFVRPVTTWVFAAMLTSSGLEGKPAQQNVSSDGLPVNFPSVISYASSLEDICEDDNGVTYGVPRYTWESFMTPSAPNASYLSTKNEVIVPSYSDILATVRKHRNDDKLPLIFNAQGKTFGEVWGKFSDEAISDLLHKAFLIHETVHACGGETVELSRDYAERYIKADDGKPIRVIGEAILKGFIFQSVRYALLEDSDTEHTLSGYNGLEETIAEFIETQEVLKIAESYELAQTYVENRIYRSLAHQQFLTTLQSNYPDFLETIVDMRKRGDIVGFEKYLQKVTCDYLMQSQGMKKEEALLASDKVALSFIITSNEKLSNAHIIVSDYLIMNESLRSKAFRRVLEDNSFYTTLSFRTTDEFYRTQISVGNLFPY